MLVPIENASRTAAFSDYLSKVQNRHCLDSNKPVVTVFMTGDLMNDQSRARLVKSSLVQRASPRPIGYSPAIRRLAVESVRTD